jgi:hypothetical protein
MWSSGTQNPTQTKNDHIFATKEWELLYPTAVFRLPARWSLTIAQWFSLVHHFKKIYRGFRFEAYWLHLPDLKEVVTQSWSKPVDTSNKG